ncbi:MAG: LacI family DNA-binding transcriptional regulator [Gluconacetobacter diazotrophicus]|nr:LacI family DNA-binding transcriptional regulator [Gluconacetobacter diazotrophicus]
MTVTRVFLRPDQVSPATRARVENAVAALHYVPDRAAGGLATRRSGFVGLVVPILANANFAALAEGLTESLRATGHELLIGYTSYDGAEEARQVRTLLSRRPEAIVLAGPIVPDPVRRLLAAAGLPVVEVADLPEHPAGHAIGFSNRAAGAAAASFLLSLGHRRLAAIGPSRDGDRHDPRGEARILGFTETLRAAGHRTDLVLSDGIVPLSFAAGARAMARLLDDTTPRTRPDAVFAVSDLVAVGAAMECRRRELVLPDQLSLLGFGDFDIGRELVPPLSTVAVDFRDLGARAGVLVGRLLAGEASQPRQRLDVGFVIVGRGTTRHAPPRRTRRP